MNTCMGHKIWQFYFAGFLNSFIRKFKEFFCETFYKAFNPIFQFYQVKTIYAFEKCILCVKIQITHQN